MGKSFKKDLNDIKVSQAFQEYYDANFGKRLTATKLHENVTKEKPLVVDLPTINPRGLPSDLKYKYGEYTVERKQSLTCPRDTTDEDARLLPFLPVRTASDLDNLHNLPPSTKKEADRHFIILNDPTEYEKRMNVLKTEDMSKKAKKYKEEKPYPEILDQPPTEEELEKVEESLTKIDEPEPEKVEEILPEKVPETDKMMEPELPEAPEFIDPEQQKTEEIKTEVVPEQDKPNEPLPLEHLPMAIAGATMLEKEVKKEPTLPAPVEIEDKTPTSPEKKKQSVYPDNNEGFKIVSQPLDYSMPLGSPDPGIPGYRMSYGAGAPRMSYGAGAPPNPLAPSYEMPFRNPPAHGMSGSQEMHYRGHSGPSMVGQEQGHYPDRNYGSYGEKIHQPMELCPKNKRSKKPQGLNFDFQPYGNCCTEISLTIEPDEPDALECAVNNGIMPIVCCYLPPNFSLGGGPPFQNGVNNSSQMGGSQVNSGPQQDPETTAQNTLQQNDRLSSESPGISRPSRKTDSAFPDRASKSVMTARESWENSSGNSRGPYSRTTVQISDKPLYRDARESTVSRQSRSSRIPGEPHRNTFAETRADPRESSWRMSSGKPRHTTDESRLSSWGMKRNTEYLNHSTSDPRANNSRRSTRKSPERPRKSRRTKLKQEIRESLTSSSL